MPPQLKAPPKVFVGRDAEMTYDEFKNREE
jgi:hypothetical protein